MVLRCPAGDVQSFCSGGMVERGLTYMAQGETEWDRAGWQVRRMLSHTGRVPTGHK